MSTSFIDLGLPQTLCQTLSSLGFEEPTPIQTAAIPVLLSGRDVLGQAATGTGKTAAFALPLMARYCMDAEPLAQPRVLVLTPTRELCLQVAESFMSYGKACGLTVAPIYGGQEYGRQIRLLKRGVHVVVATPGRALDHINKGTLDLSAIRALVLDEADEMLDMGFADELSAILEVTSADRQTALFSATLPQSIQSIALKHLNAPERIVIETERPSAGEVPRVPQVAYMVGRAHRHAALGRILDVAAPELAIVFARTRVETDEVTEALRARGFAVEALHGGLDQDSRSRVIKRAKDGAIEVLVATDVAARGLDLDNVTHVINFGLPAAAETYVHRIGRTGRAGRSGMAVSLIEPREHRRLRVLEAATGGKIEVQSVPSVTDVRAKRLEIARSTVAQMLEGREYDKYRVVAEQLCEQSDPFDVAAAAIAALDAALGGTQDEDEIPAVSAFERPKKRSERDRAKISDRRPEHGMTRIFIGAGRALGVRPGDIVGAIANEAGISARRIGAIDIADKFCLVEVDTPVASAIIDALRQTTIKGRNVTVRRDKRTQDAAGHQTPHFEKRREKAPRRSRFEDFEENN
jgi:ATP-dependent RNA helicase DeaD